MQSKTAGQIRLSGYGTDQNCWEGMYIWMTSQTYGVQIHEKLWKNAVGVTWSMCEWAGTMLTPMLMWGKMLVNTHSTVLNEFRIRARGHGDMYCFFCFFFISCYYFNTKLSIVLSLLRLCQWLDFPSLL